MGLEWTASLGEPGDGLVEVPFASEKNLIHDPSRNVSKNNLISRVIETQRSGRS